MTYFTYAQLKTKIEEELDLEQETFIQTNEMLDYFNRAVKEAESAIHTMNLEVSYFKTSASLALVNGDADVTLPSNLYEQKILGIVYDNGSDIYEITKLTGRDKLLKKKIIANDAGSNPTYMYDIKNDDPDEGQKIELIPEAQETSSSNVTIEYIREANVLAEDDDKCDIPEFYTFILAFVKWKVRDKEGHPDTDAAKADYQEQKTLMIQTLSSRTIEEESNLEQDQSHYEEMS